jgi:hypothetical protein
MLVPIAASNNNKLALCRLKSAWHKPPSFIGHGLAPCMLTSIAGSSPSFGSAFSGEGLKDGHGLATWNAARCVRAMFTVLEGWDGVLKPVVARYQGKVSRIYFRADAGFASPEGCGLKKISGASSRGSLTFCNNFAVCHSRKDLKTLTISTP